METVATTTTKPARIVKPRVTARVNPAAKVKPARAIDAHMVSCYSLIGRERNPETGKFEPVECVTVRCHFNPRGNGLQPVRCNVWIRAPRGSGLDWLSGRGDAGGCGYHKESAAIADAISNAGVELFGDPYQREGARNKRPLHFGGTGFSGYAAIFEAIARARGFRGPFLLVSN